jgi:hypothetical protein
LLVIHWNGRHWLRSTFPVGSGNDRGGLTSVAASSPTDVWAAGFEEPAEAIEYGYSVLMHWNGKRWARVRPPGIHTILDALALLRPGDLWATANNPFAYAQHGSGTSVLNHVHGWTSSQFSDGDWISALAPDTAGGLWAVGKEGSGLNDGGDFPGHVVPLVERYGC